MSLFKIPRTKFARTDERWALVRKFGTSRRKMVDFITSIGGYSAWRSGQFAIEFNIAAYETNFDDPAKLWAMVNDNFGYGLGLKKPHEEVLAYHLFCEAYTKHKELLWEWGTEEAYESWSGSDTPYETFADIRVNWSHEVHGRGGKHLCMTECEGITLRCSPEELEEALMEKEGVYDGAAHWGGYIISTEVVKKLFLICVQNSVELTPTKVSHEVEYSAAWRLWASFCEDNMADALQAYETRERLAGDAEAIKDMLEDMRADGSTLADAFATILRLAGITIKEE